MYPNLRAELSRRNLNVRTFALLVGMPYSTLNDKMKGRRPITFEEAMKMKQALNVDIPLEVLFSKEIAS